MRTFLIALAFAVIVGAQPASAQIVSWPGKIVVSADEWPLSDDSFEGTQAEQLALNVADFFTGGQPGKFLVYSQNFGLTGARLAETMTRAGHSWTIDPFVSFSLARLQQYDAVFLAGEPADNKVLSDYVKSGGGVYLAAGTGARRMSKAAEAGQWNTFLKTFGLKLEPSAYNFFEYVEVPASWRSPVFEGVGSFFYWTGHLLSLTDAHSTDTRLFVAANIPRFAVYAANIVSVDADICLGPLDVTATLGLGDRIRSPGLLGLGTITLDACGGD